MSVRDFDVAQLDARLPDETASERLMRRVLVIVAEGLREAGCPLTDAQAAFLDGGAS